jgi:hypothetical protein
LQQEMMLLLLVLRLLRLPSLLVVLQPMPQRLRDLLLVLLYWLLARQPKKQVLQLLRLLLFLAVLQTMLRRLQVLRLLWLPPLLVVL